MNYVLNNNRTKFVIFCLSLLAAPDVFASEQLIFSIDLIRHGDRTAVFNLPAESSDYKHAVGELTTEGMKQEYQLGKAVRQEYVTKYHLLPENYQANTMYVRSTDTERTRMSAIAFLRGLYPSSQAIPIHTVPLDQESLLAAKPNKDAYVFTQQDKKQLDQQLIRWRKLTGLPLTDWRGIILLADNLYVRQIHHLPLIKNMSMNEANQIIKLANVKMVAIFKNKQSGEAMGREFLRATAQSLSLAAHHKTTLKYILYSAHDSSIMSVMSALGMPLETVPPYAAHINFSLFRKGKNDYVEVHYNGRLISLPACKKSRCSLSQFQGSNLSMMYN
jgi:hypothetical protein